MKPIGIQQLRRWSQGNRCSAGHLNEPLDAINAILAQLAQVGEDGDPPAIAEAWVGTIVATGPQGETLKSVNAKGEQYWVQRNFIVGGPQNAPISLGADGPALYDSLSNSSNAIGGQVATPLPDVFLVTNLPELKHHSHLLETGISVWVIAYYDGGLSPLTSSYQVESGPPSPSDDNQKHYLMCLNPGGDPLYSLIQNNGSAGDASTICSFTYDVYPFNDESGSPLFTAVQWIARPAWTQKMVDASYGTLFQSGSTTYLKWTNEYPDVGKC